ncbi:zinc finger MYM-type protein 1-like [Ambystoma mexicanum]|uniref:zinc finger MYM-type protein 1-like n=1 Tax=Ambystoma mexicanum TaxID=8296 RepID=UPI0037E9A888
MSTPTGKPKDPKQRSIVDMFSPKARGAGPTPGSDSSKRKRSDDNSSGSSNTAAHVVQPSASTSTLAGSEAASSGADSASTCADIGSLSPHADSLSTAPPSLADIASPSFVVATEGSCSHADIAVTVSRDADDPSNTSTFLDSAECSFNPDVEDCSSRIGMFDDPPTGACSPDISLLGESTSSSWLQSDNSMQMCLAEQGIPRRSPAPNLDDSVVTDLSPNPCSDPVQPKLPTYPVTGSRKFNGDYKTYPWVEYSVLKDKVYCFACRHFGSNSGGGGRARGNVPFVDIGFAKWEKTRRSLKMHSDSDKHKSSVVAWADFKCVQQTTGPHHSIVSMLEKVGDQEIEENRQHVLQLLKVVCVLGRQGLAFRATDESQDSHNKGNFIAILRLLSDNNELLKVKMARRYGHYTSPEYQNDMISVVANLIRQNIVRKVTKHFAVLVDETKDISHKEQMSFVIRFVDQDGNIQEKAMGCYHMEKLDASSLAAAIHKSVRDAGLDWKNCVAQCYDGASVMSGCFNGVQAKIKEIAPQAVYIHCHAHRLNLALVQTITNIQTVKDFFSTLQAVYVFLSQSSPRHELFVKAQTESGLEVQELERLCGTRWFYWYACVKKIQARFETIIVVLSLIESSQQRDKQACSEARGLLRNMQCFEFLLTLLSMEAILKKIRVLSDELQRKHLDLPDASHLIQVTRTALVNLRQECHWVKIVNDATELAEKCGIETVEDHDRRALPVRHHQLCSKLKEYLVGTTVGKRPGHYEHSEDRMPQTERIKQEVFFCTLDRFVRELDARFIDNMGLIKAAGMFNPRAKHFLEDSSADLLARHYLGPQVDYAALHSGLDTARGYLSGKTLAGIHSVRYYLNESPRGFSDVLNLLDLVLALPITTATNERFFSCLKRVKNYLRNRCGDNRLSDLLVMACEPMEVEEVNLSDAIDRFADMRHRRYPLKR